jgi:D-glycero-D-manno-heptose 1,7-bisphosphate phosphatase
METVLGLKRAYVNRVYYCPHHPEAGYPGEVGALKIACTCRKPAAGMLLQASREFNISLAGSWMIGDAQRDIQAGIEAGCKTIYIPSGDVYDGAEADYICTSLSDAVDIILGKAV